MSATISEASHSASGATDCRLMVQLPLLVRGIADDIEFHPAAERMPIQRVVDPRPDLIEGGRSFCKKRLEIHLRHPLRKSAAVAADRPVGLLLG